MSSPVDITVRTFTSSLKSPVLKVIRVGIADSLLVGYVEAEFVECGLSERNDAFRSPAGCAFIARVGSGGSPKNDSWGNSQDPFDVGWDPPGDREERGKDSSNRTLENTAVIGIG